MKINELCKAVLANPTNFNLIQAYEQYLGLSEYNPYGVPEDLETALSQAVSNHADARVLELGYTLLDFCPWDIEIHVLIAQAANRLNDKKTQHLHHYIASLLLDRILATGDGKQPETAYKINYPKEQLALFHHLKCFPEERLHFEKNGRFYDVYTIKDKSQIFFDITNPINRAAELEKRNLK